MTNSYAKYVLFATSEIGNEVFIDDANIKQLDNKHVRVWSYSNQYHSKDPAYVITGSVLELEEFDCKEEKSSVLHMTSYEEYNLKGKILLNFSPEPKWEYIIPNSIQSMTLNYVCKSVKLGNKNK